MKVGISNLAWLPVHDDAVAVVLDECGVESVDIAPGRYFGERVAWTTSEARTLRIWWRDRGLAIDGLQGLFFGLPDLNLLGEAPVRSAALAHLDRMFALAVELGARELTLGSPKNRDKGQHSDETALALGCEVFGQSADIASRYGVVLCLEPIPKVYGGTFATDTLQTAGLVAAVGSPSFRLQLDTGAMFRLGECAGEVVPQCGPLVGHIHASEPGLGALGGPSYGGMEASRGASPDLGTVAMSAPAHREIAGWIAKYLPHRRVTVEMLPSTTKPAEVVVFQALQFALEHYGPHPSARARVGP